MKKKSCKGGSRTSRPIIRNEFKDIPSSAVSATQPFVRDPFVLEPDWSMDSKEIVEAQKKKKQ